MNIQNICNYINLEYRSELDLKKLSIYAGVSYHHLCREFKQKTGKTVIAYITELRVDYAKNQLEETFYSCEEIGKLSGFGTNVQFFRSFKKLVGDTPMKYRKKYYGVE